MKQQKQRNAKLEKMIGKTYLYKARQRRIDGYRYDDGEVIIHTDGADIRIDENDLREVLLRDFLPLNDDTHRRFPRGGDDDFEVEEEEQEAGGVEESVIKKEKRPELKALIVLDEGRIPNLLETLMETIERVKQDKDFVPQAKVINSSVNTAVNVAKLFLMVNKEAKGNGR